MVRMAVCLLAVGFLASSVDAGPFRRVTHNGLVRQSGITPNQVGMAEGVGVSSKSYEDAVQNACFWGKREAISIQYSQRGGKYYAVVRYR